MSANGSFARRGRSRADAVPLSSLDRRGIVILGGIGAFAVVLLATVVGVTWTRPIIGPRSEEHTSELQSRGHLVCRLLLEKKKKKIKQRKREYTSRCD